MDHFIDITAADYQSASPSCHASTCCSSCARSARITACVSRHASETAKISTR
jgi:hypothetical protein